MKIRGNNKGFTLTEVLIAVAILSIAVVPMLANFVTSTKVNSKSKRTMNGTAVAQNIMEGINAYGVENTIIQLENIKPAPNLKFMPNSMRVANWGRCIYEVDAATTTNTEHNTVRIPVYASDSYQDNTRTYTDTDGTVNFADVIEMKDKEVGVYGAYGTSAPTLDTSYSDDSRMKYAYRSLRAGETDKVYFIDDKRKEKLMNDPLGPNNTGYAHAYMFWLENVEYGNKKYDVLLTMDANHYRKYEENDLDTTKASVNMATDDLRTEIETPRTGNDYANKRTYNDEMLSRITNNTGTNASINDTTPDRFCVTADSKFDEVVSDFVTRCKAGVTREEIMEALQREIVIKIEQSSNPMAADKPYRIITVAYNFTLVDTSLLDPIRFAREAGLQFANVAAEDIFRSCEKSPRNIYFYYTPNYEGDIGISDGTRHAGDIITIINNGEKDADDGREYGSDINLFIVRQTKAFDDRTPDPEIDAIKNNLPGNEGSYVVEVEIRENLVHGSLTSADLKNVNTHIYTNIDYSLVDNKKLTSRMGLTRMGRYKVNGGSFLSDDDIDKKLRVAGLDGINRKEGATQRDYIYEVTVQVFEPGRDYAKEARIAKFTGSSN